ncbi:FecCD family ABC transporter permease [Microbacterium jejuense]|uniref:FecCD family ABC transporter permease n=1 Tax=Microbacterium jejuense TaxID=1263637 RepID=UPI0031F032F1
MTAASTARSGATTRAWRAHLRRRTAIVCAGLGAVVVALFITALLLGEAGLSPAEVLSAFTGRADRITAYVVLELRLPRALAAAIVGACLGASGAVFQSVVRNPLASPDIVGITSGAGFAGVVAVVVLHASGIALSFIVIAGGIAAAIAVAMLTWQRGIHGLRLVLVGIGVAALATALTSYLLTRVDIREAGVAYTWLVGSLNGASWPIVSITLILAVIAFVALAWRSRALRALELGDTTAAALGFRVERDRVVVLLIATVLAAIAVGASGPIAFVALMAPQIARRLVGRTSLSLVAAAATGAALVSAADLLAQYLVPGVSFPVGVVTGAIGAPYLAWLLARSNRTRSGGTT